MQLWWLLQLDQGCGRISREGAAGLDCATRAGQRDRGMEPATSRACDLEPKRTRQPLVGWSALTRCGRIYHHRAAGLSSERPNQIVLPIGSLGQRNRKPRDCQNASAFKFATFTPKWTPNGPATAAFSIHSCSKLDPTPLPCSRGRIFRCMCAGNLATISSGLCIGWWIIWCRRLSGDQCVGKPIGSGYFARS